MRLTRPQRRTLAWCLSAALLATMSWWIWIGPSRITWTMTTPGLGIEERAYGAFEWIVVRREPVAAPTPGAVPVPATTTAIDLSPLAVAGGLAISLAVVLGAIVMHRRIVRDRLPAGRCDHCGYDLTGVQSGACPECGEPMAGARTASDKATKRRSDAVQTALDRTARDG